MLSGLESVRRLDIEIAEVYCTRDLDERLHGISIATAALTVRQLCSSKPATHGSWLEQLADHHRRLRLLETE